MAPRVLIVAPRLDVGGTEVHLARVLPRLRRAGLDVSIFTIARGGRLESEFAAAGVPVLGVNVAGPRPWRSLRAAYVLRREIRRLNPQILHFFLPEPALIGSLAAAALSDSIRIMSRRSLSHYRRNHPVFALVDRRVSCSMDILLGNSSAVAAELVEDCGDVTKVGIIHNGIEVQPAPDAQARAICRSKLGIAHDAFVIVMIANLFPYKGHADLLAALGLVHDRLRSPWRLLLVGRDQGIGAALQSQSAALGLNANILWLGERSDTQDLLAAADLGILVSHQEGFSNSLIEMMAQALPVIATRVGGNIDAVVDGESGRLVPVKDNAALGQAILGLYEDAVTRRRMGEAARWRVEQLFSLQLCVNRYLNLYRYVLSGKTSQVAQLIDPPGGALETPTTEKIDG